MTATATHRPYEFLKLERHGPGARLLVIPEGSQSIPYIAS